MFDETYPMQAIAPTAARVLGVPSPRSAEAQPIDAVVRDLSGAKRVAVIGVDALGKLIFEHWSEKMPFLTGMIREKSFVVRSIMISKTPVNFGCMVTGASMNVHGVTQRVEPFKCETLFDVLRANGKVSAGLGRKNWTGDELLGRFADISANGRAEDDFQLEAFLLETITGKRPDYLITQFGLTDEMFHVYGPYAPEVETAVTHADEYLRRVTPILRAEGYGVIILADHGQHTIVAEEGGRRGTHGSDSDEDRLVPLTWAAPTA